jgi:glycosyltransferase involved in cell wall biosynthesis
MALMPDDLIPIPHDRKMNLPKITLLTCTRNGAGTIQQALEAIAEQSDVPGEVFEVLIIDNASTDNTSELARNTIDRLGLEGRVICEPCPGKMNAFLRGVYEAKGELVSIIDDDNFIDPGFIRHTLELFDRYPDVGISGSANRIMTDHPVPDWFAWVSGRYACAQPWLDEIDTVDADGVTIAKTAAIAGAGSTFRLKPLLACLDHGYKFFNDLRSGIKITVTGEDIELCWLMRSLGYRFAHDPRVRVRHAIKPERLNFEHFKVFSKAIGAGSLGIDPFLFTHKHDSRDYPVQWTWQWQLVTKLKRYSQLVFLQKLARLSQKQKFRNQVDRLECLGAIKRILLEREKYTGHIRQVSSGEWTQLRVR